MSDQTPRSAPTPLEEQLVDAARNGDVPTLTALLEKHPAKLHLRSEPYEWSLLHHAASNRHLSAVDLLLTRGLDVNTREKGDNTYAMHWAAAAGTLDVVRRLADAGGDVVGRGDDHELEVIGWATCWDECDTAAHRAVADFLVSRGARHHIFSAIAMNLADEVRRIAAGDSSALNRRQSRNEDHRTALHFAVVKNRPDMVALLLELGADPLAVDGSGQPVATYATTPDVDRPLMEKIGAMAAAELTSAERGHRQPRATSMDLLALLARGDFHQADRLLRENAALIAPSGGVLHLMAKRNDGMSVKWLLDHGADVNGMWPHWDAEVTPLHLAACQGHADMVRRLLAAGADRTIRDSKHDASPIGWAEHFRHPEIVKILEDRAAEA